MDTSLLEVKSSRGKVKWIIDEKLAKKQGLDDKRLRLIGDAYREKDRIERAMKSAVKTSARIKARGGSPGYYDRKLQPLFRLWKRQEFILQALWRFELDEKFHKDYLLPGCTCPKMDNDDAYPVQRWVSADCIFHGGSHPVVANSDKSKV